ncbi:protoporphyrinogen oxidase [Actinoplanes oblitus]|uniref:Coproporphyrinogen III oxidase n=1 Tax=Actinoplanes oblitus TaxID=3040509 RepID=A0ABY8WQK3_9ACTN|nr:protoporphyrinogen oxidase [Actinoplanes oblitus]WIN00162.1 protoporphyrinogen oxidase [Actinoplanes oblitus]
MPKRVAVIGGGIAGLAAAVRIHDLAPQGTQIVIYERGDVLGGKMSTGELLGNPVERGAESFLTSSPDGTPSAAVRLAERVGLGDALVHPAARSAALAAGGNLDPIPGGTLMGIPRDTGDSDRDKGAPLLGPGEDITVGALVRDRCGDNVVDRHVDPLLGGVYAGSADTLSLEATLPALAAAARSAHTLAAAVRAVQSAVVRPSNRPMFASVIGGLGRLVTAAAAASGARIELGVPVRRLLPTRTGWRLLADSAPSTQADDVDAVVIAVPAAPALPLLTCATNASDAGSALDLPYASVALVAMALPAGTPLPDLSGILVPSMEGTLVKAATFVTHKWANPARPDGPVIIRASLAHAGEEQRLDRDDAALARQAHRELSALLRAGLPSPTDFWVQRWDGGLPQYRTKHKERVAVLRDNLPPGIALAGAAYDGIGIPACIVSGETAADGIVDYLRML